MNPVSLFRFASLIKPSVPQARFSGSGQGSDNIPYAVTSFDDLAQTAIDTAHLALTEPDNETLAMAAGAAQNLADHINPQDD